MLQVEPTVPETESGGGRVVNCVTKSDLVSATTAFALDLYAALRQSTDGNLLISPYSNFQVLAMAYAGARGETAAQIGTALRLGKPTSSFHQALAALTGELLARGNLDANNFVGFGAQHLRIANGIWGQQGHQFSPAYLEEAERHYGSGIQLADFAGAAEAARRAINAWVAEQTEGRIREIAPRGAITPATRLVLANAVWFLGAWQNPFKQALTHYGDFSLIDGTSTTVRFMNQQTSLAYARGDGFQVIEFPYQRKASTFTVVVPEAGNFRAFEAGLEHGALDKALDGLSDRLVDVYMPKFELRLDGSLVESLKALGITDAFDPRRADFTGTGLADPPDPLSIGNVLHSTFLRLDERGTEAAAAILSGWLSLGMVEQPEPVVVRIDRPFIFAIRDSATGTVLFLGRVLRPDS